VVRAMPVFAPSLFESEAAFQAQLIGAAKWMGWRIFHVHDSRRTQPGFPDLCLVKPPRIIFAELKMEKGKTTKEQEQWLAALKECPGVEAYLFRPSDWSDILMTLSKREGSYCQVHT
jgi:hypothetical protein